MTILLTKLAKTSLNIDFEALFLKYNSELAKDLKTNDTQHEHILKGKIVA